MGNFSDFFEELDEPLENSVLQKLLDRDIDPAEREIFTLTARNWGLAIPRPSEVAQTEFKNSKQITQKIFLMYSKVLITIFCFLDV